MSVRDTSRAAYDALQATARLGEQQRTIVRFLAKNAHRDFTRAELAAATNLRINAVCGRVNELIKAKFLTDGPRRVCRVTGNTAHALSIVSIQTELPLEVV